MAAPSRWIRLNATWSQSEWLAVLSPGARLAWIELICYMKTTGVGGACKALSPVVASRLWGIPPGDIETLLHAAIDADALHIQEDGAWTLPNWDVYQRPDRTAADRMRRHRAGKSRLSPLRRDVRDTERTGANAGVTRRVTETETETEERELPSQPLLPLAHGGELSRAPSVSEKWPVKPRQAGAGYVYPEAFEAIWSAYPRRGGSNPKVGAYRVVQRLVSRGIDADTLLSATRNYATSMEHAGKVGTELVMQATTFFGPQEPWREYLDAPIVPETPHRNGNGVVHDPFEEPEAQAALARQEAEYRRVMGRGQPRQPELDW